MINNIKWQTYNSWDNQAGVHNGKENRHVIIYYFSEQENKQQINNSEFLTVLEEVYHNFKSVISGLPIFVYLNL